MKKHHLMRERDYDFAQTISLTPGDVIWTIEKPQGYTQCLDWMITDVMLSSDCKHVDTICSSCIGEWQKNFVLVKVTEDE